MDINEPIQPVVFSPRLDSILKAYQSVYDIKNKPDYFYVIEYGNHPKDTVFRIWAYQDPLFFTNSKLYKAYYYSDTYNYLIVENDTNYFGINDYNRNLLDTINKSKKEFKGTYSVFYPRWYYKIVNNKIELNKKELDSIVYYWIDDK